MLSNLTIALGGQSILEQEFSTGQELEATHHDDTSSSLSPLTQPWGRYYSTPGHNASCYDTAQYTGDTNVYDTLTREDTPQYNNASSFNGPMTHDTAQYSHNEPLYSNTSFTCNEKPVQMIHKVIK